MALLTHKNFAVTFSENCAYGHSKDGWKFVALEANND